MSWRRQESCQLVALGSVVQLLYIRQMNQQKKIKLIISSLKEKELIQFFEIYADYYLPDLAKSVKKISFNCYEATFEYQHITVNGYGKNYNESLTSAIENFVDKLLEQDTNYNSLRDCLKKYSQMFNIPNLQPSSSDKSKKTTCNQLQKKVGCVLRTQDCVSKAKESNIKSVKTLKEEIFESLNHQNIQLRPGISSHAHTINKTPSYSNISQPSRNQQLSGLLDKIKELEDKLTDAQEENEFLKARIREKDSKQARAITHVASNSKFERYHIPEPKNIEKDNYLKDISNKLSNTTISQDLGKDQSKIRSYSLSNSINPSAFNSKTAAKIKIPKLNLQVLPNYHGKSNKSLNQSLLEAYEKKTKGSNLHI